MFELVKIPFQFILLQRKYEYNTFRNLGVQSLERPDLLNLLSILPLWRLPKFMFFNRIHPSKAVDHMIKKLCPTLFGWIQILVFCFLKGSRLNPSTSAGLEGSTTVMEEIATSGIVSEFLWMLGSCLRHL